MWAVLVAMVVAGPRPAARPLVHRRADLRVTVGQRVVRMAPEIVRKVETPEGSMTIRVCAGKAIPVLSQNADHVVLFRMMRDVRKIDARRGQTRMRCKLRGVVPRAAFIELAIHGIERERGETRFHT